MTRIINDADVKEIFSVVERKAKKRGLVAIYQNNDRDLVVKKDHRDNDSAYLIVNKTTKCEGFDVAYKMLFTVSGVCSAVELTTKDLSDVDGFVEKAFQALQRDMDRRDELRIKRDNERKELEVLKKMIPVNLAGKIGLYKHGADLYDLNLSSLTYSQAQTVLQTL